MPSRNTAQSQVFKRLCIPGVSCETVVHVYLDMAENNYEEYGTGNESIEMEGLYHNYTTEYVKNLAF